MEISTEVSGLFRVCDHNQMPPSRDDVVQKAAAFAPELLQAKSAAAEDAWSWYPYDSLANVAHLHRLLADRHPTIETLLHSGHLLDIGCADADLALFLERLGAHVTAVDHTSTNFNGLRGAAALLRHFQSTINLHDWDLDHSPPPAVADSQFDLALVLGILYHLQNPLLVLNSVARLSRYAIVSTRVLHGEPTLDALPLAYLLSEDELNADNSNFWLPTVKGLARMFRRAGWECGPTLLLSSNSKTNDPWTTDTRCFALLRSAHALQNLTLGEGWYDQENDWRWTAPDFHFTLPPLAPNPTELALEVYAHPGLFPQNQPVAVSINSHRLVLAESGHQTLRAPSRGGDITVHIDGHVRTANGDPRALGLVVKRVFLS